MRLFKSLFAASIALCSYNSVSARSAFGDRVLVVLEAEAEQATYSKFWSSLQERGFDLSFRTPDSGKLLFEFDAPVYEHVILFAPSAKSTSADLSPQSLFDFLSRPDQTPHNLLIALSPSTSETWRDFAREFSLEFDVRGNTLLDPFASDNATLVPVYPPTFSAEEYPIVVTGNKPVQYSGLAHSIAQGFPLAKSLLSAPATSYSHNTNSPLEVELDGSVPALIGGKSSLVTAFQTKNGARVVWSGSLDLFSDARMNEQSGNQDFVRDISSWVFQEEGVLSIDQVVHAKLGESEARDEYRVEDVLVYSAAISQYTKDHWRPAQLSGLQLEITMLDPFIRLPLHPASIETGASTTAQSSTLYTANFNLPTRHGVFTFFLDHKRFGYTWIENKHTVAVTPPRHDQWPRWIEGAVPYYLGAVSTISVGFLGFTLLWLGVQERDSKVKKNK